MKNPWPSENFHSVENGGMKPIFKTLFRKLKNDASISLSPIPPPKKRKKETWDTLRAFKTWQGNDAVYMVGSQAAKIGHKKSCIAANTQKVISKLYMQRQK